MLHVKTPEEVYQIIRENFDESANTETLSLFDACGRILAEPVISESDEPPFDRSTVDGFALRAADSFGSSESLPVILEVQGQIKMGEAADEALRPDSCFAIPTGGALPPEADCVVMQEFTEDYEDGTIGVTRPAAPGENIIFRGDDTRCGEQLLEKGKILKAADIGLMASLGMTEVTVQKELTVGIISTGDELVPEGRIPGPGQIRDINSSMLAALCRLEGCRSISYGIIPDRLELLEAALKKALTECDMVLMSGGSSVGERDNSLKALTSLGEILFHGIAMKPGKPTILGKALGKPVFGLPGHPQAAYFTAKLYVCAMIDRLYSRKKQIYRIPAKLTRTVSANDGRALYMPVILTRKKDLLYADPIHSKSGLISNLSRAQGYLCIERNCEGMRAGDTVMITLF